jgi:hypothetical protein|tara:strand:- start:215 stop:328 length:114 start_codon:yes stop_codon:yes gene_type:complete
MAHPTKEIVAAVDRIWAIHGKTKWAVKTELARWGQMI